MNQGWKKKLKKTVTITLSVLIALMAIFVGYLTWCNVSGRVAFLGQYASVKIISPSMEPTIPVNSYILAEKVDSGAVEEGDVILFYSRDPAIYGRINTHRVVEIHSGSDGLSFVTKGDNNFANDSLPVPQSDLVGRYVKNVPWLTAFSGFFSNPLVFFIFVIIPALALILVSVWDVVKKAREVKMELLVEEEVKRLKEENENKERSDHV